VAASGNDVGRLCADLRAVEQEFLSRTGRFASVPLAAHSPAESFAPVAETA
jgi:hypothetical protein